MIIYFLTFLFEHFIKYECPEKHIKGKLLPVLLGSEDIKGYLGNLQHLRISSIKEIEIVVETIDELIGS